MTEQEAIAIIKKNYPKCCKMVNGRYKGGFDNTDCELGQAFNIAIKALEEVQQCRAIGTLEECRKARTVRREVQEIVDQQLIAGEDSYEEIYACFWEIVKVVQANY